jgi:predicted metal-dependent phosphoesterase TrpH
MWKKAFLYSSLIAGLLFGSACARADPDRVLGGPGDYVGNIHTHTTANSGENTYHEMVDEAVRLGFDFLVITDHGTISWATRYGCPREKRLLCVIGEEIDGEKLHILAIGIDKVIPEDMTDQEYISRAGYQ